MPPRSCRAPAGLAAAIVAFLWVLAAAHADPGAAISMPPPASPDAAARHVDREALMAAVRTLSAPEYAGRRTGTPGGLAARRFIVRQFEGAGLSAAFATGFVQPFHRGGKIRGAANVAGLVRGTGSGTRAIVVSAHYDHLGVRDGVVHPGADDNASGVAVLLAAAKHFASEPPRHSMIFVAFDAEELALAGAKAFVHAPPVPVGRMAINVNLDMLARSDRREIVAAGAYHSPWLVPVLEQVQRRAAVRIVPGRDRPGRRPGSREDWTLLSDHGVFHQAGVSFLYFGVEDHGDYHRPEDTADKIDPVFFGDVADMVIEALIVLDRDLPR